MKKEIVIGSRASVLAVVQSELVRDAICREHADLDVRIMKMKTSGDRILDRKLSEIGGKGLFVKELDRALLAGETDLSVHSMKDLPMEVDPSLPVVCCSKREDPRDVLVLPEGKTELDPSLPVGTSSDRRILQLQPLFPGVRFESVRGNLQTRLRKLDEGAFSGIILAAAGLKRLGLEGRISRYFPVEEVIPSAGQGILAVQGRACEDYAYLAHLADPEAALAAKAERAFVRALDGGCTSPIGSHAVVQGDRMTLLGFYHDTRTGKSRRGQISGSAEDAEQLAQELAEQLK